ncbi:phosphoenolpyruvate--protein phosphotransferase [Thermodesulforhabdus norvegica]|uniref:Phosphoenolpyruvate-protein phosphotransferase n=1 Tax=Thermodesulforhabdus norvegica TaxID=39841 RepID=A0A1I4W2G1_9BACT|nr:phosphoenolpyruvate--protein phosphotransferase [Thermodesulforhabdus norvegica]SFN07691.1 phosphoenolpyruvate--protein phosphotransferase [Thermodesulforhabdus norvegica]
MTKQKEIRLRGIGVSQGIAIGKAFVVEKGRVSIPYYTLWDEGVIEEECRRFERAVRQVEDEFLRLKDSLREDLRDYASLLEVHRMILRDRLIYDETIRLIREKGLNAMWALSVTLDRVHRVFQSVDDSCILDRLSDVGAVVDRVMRKLSGDRDDIFSGISERSILVTHDLSPADAIQLPLEKVMAFVLDIGGRTSHTAIMARSLDIPAVLATERATREIQTGDLIIVDGTSGDVIIRPGEHKIRHYVELQFRLENYIREIARKASAPAITADGYRIGVDANIEMLEDVVFAKDSGAEGIGLFRSEFAFMNREKFPTEEELYQDYRQLAELMAPHAVTIRTLDVGSEKLSPWFSVPDEPNPALGLRSVRLCMRYPQVLKMQLRAILRAGAGYGNVRVMFPMVSGVGELRILKKMVHETMAELSREGFDFDDKIKIGIMIEVPSAVAVADLLAGEVDFFSIGTNDLIQYTLAVDRQNEYVAYLYESLHPGLLRMIKSTVDAAREAGIPVSLCGEMAGEPFYVPILLGLGLDCLSMNPQSIPRVKNLIRMARMSDCYAFVEEILKKKTAREINSRLQEFVANLFPDEYYFFRSGFPDDGLRLTT